MEAGEPELELLHSREYVVRAYRAAPDEMLLRGWVRDDKPPGLYVEGDPEPLTIHHMLVEMRVGLPALVVKAIDVRFATFPEAQCPAVAASYQKLVGVSITRGFTHKVRELLGGPRGCAHTTALIQAMAPVAVQSIWSLHMAATVGRELPPRPLPPVEQRVAAIGPNLDSCAVWARDGELIGRIERGEVVGDPIPVMERLAARGGDPARWRRRTMG